MTIEYEILELATMTSNAFGWQSMLAGYITYNHDIYRGKDKTEDEYVKEVLTFATSLNINDFSDNEESSNYLYIKEFVQKVEQGYDEAKLEQLTRNDYKLLKERKELNY